MTDEAHTHETFKDLSMQLKQSENECIVATFAYNSSTEEEIS